LAAMFVSGHITMILKRMAESYESRVNENR
jgi:hypothetical protein